MQQTLSSVFKAALIGASIIAAGAAAAASSEMRATAVVKPIGDSKVQGTVSFEQANDGVRVEAAVSGLAPNSEHGFHVHEKGDCGDEGKAAGGHFAPRNHPHGPQDGPHHAGDMPSLKADAAGNAAVNFRTKDLTIAAGPYSAVGKAVVVHAGRDDFKSQPSGDSGARIACGVVQAQ